MQVRSPSSHQARRTARELTWPAQPRSPAEEGHRHLDSYGVGQLVSIYNEVSPLGVTLTLVNVERHQKRLLELSGLLSILHVVDDRQEALSFGGNVPAVLTH